MTDRFSTGKNGFLDEGTMMKNPWLKPAFEVLDVNGECTAYAGVLRTDPLSRGLGSTRGVPASREAEGASPIDPGQPESARPR